MADFVNSQSKIAEIQRPAWTPLISTGYVMTTVDDPMTTNDPAARFWDKVADRYARRPVGDEAAYQHKLQVTQDYLRPDMDVLEFGCGTGSTAIVHAPFVNHILATDVSSKMIEIARRKAETADANNVTFKVAAFDELTGPDASYDAVLGLNILHLMRDPGAAIAKAYGLLKPGGVFISSTACLSDTMGYIRFIAPVARLLGLFPLLRIFSTKDLEKSLTKAGFTIEHQWQSGKGKPVFIVATKAA
jgi:ubiquinone/menaquinone biosynthesis C-methylase UbiE